MSPGGTVMSSGGHGPDPPLRSVYVHAPFCPARCAYCDFAVTVAQAGDAEAWLKALRAEWRQVSEEGTFLPDPPLETLYVGGGTPSFLGVGAMGGLARILGRKHLGSSDLEWTGEANPDSFSREVAADWARAGVNRVSLGVQSFHAATLAWLGRAHGPREAREAVYRARAAGMENIGLDLLFGLPQEVERSWAAELASALALEVPHISLYGLTVEPGTPLAARVEARQATPVSEDRYREEFLEAAETLKEEGYRHYEVSNFARPGHESRHNQVYWGRRPYLGLGNSAHSFRGLHRRWNLRHWAAYQGSCLRGEPPWTAMESLSPEEIRMEEIWLGLRTDQGVALAALNEAGRALVLDWSRAGLAQLQEASVRLQPEGWLLLDRLVVDLVQALEDGGNGGDGLTLEPDVLDLSRL